MEFNAGWTTVVPLLTVAIVACLSLVLALRSGDDTGPPVRAVHPLPTNGGRRPPVIPHPRTAAMAAGRAAPRSERETP